MTELHIYSSFTEVVSGHRRKTGNVTTSVPGALVGRYVGICLDIGTMFEDALFPRKA